MRATKSATIAGFFLLGCQGTIRDSHTGGSGTATQTFSRGADAPGSARVLEPAPAGLRPLTLSEYQDTLSDLLGDLTLPPIDAETSSIAASRSGFSPLLVEQYETAALATAQQVFASPMRRDALLGCAPSSAANDACVHDFVARFGRLAWRRSLVSDEIVRYTALVGSATLALGDVLAALESTVAAMLESPYFLYRVELGEPGTVNSLRYTSQEMGERLSYFLWNAGPDEDLLKEAEGGGLVNDDALDVAVDRALVDPRARRGVSRWFSDWLELDGLSTLDKDRTALPLMTDTLGPSMRDEIMAVVDDAVFGRGTDAHELFTERSTFVNAELANLYGVGPVTGTAFSAVTLPANGQRAGVLGWSGILALHAKPKKTFPTSRGKFIRMSLLCQNIPPPPPNVNTSLDFTGANAVMTARQRLEKHRANPSCAACHSLTDPLGLALEHFDAIGAYRADDNGLALDTTGVLDGAAFNDARELGERVAAHPDVMGCVIRQLFRFASGHTDTEGEAVVMQALSDEFAASGFRIERALKDVVLSDAFRKAAP